MKGFAIMLAVCLVAAVYTVEAQAHFQFCNQMNLFCNTAATTIA